MSRKFFTPPQPSPNSRGGSKKFTNDLGWLYIGSRVEMGAKGLSDSLPAVDRQCAVYYTDFLVAYKKVLPRQRHKSVGKIRAKLRISKDARTP